MRIPKAAIPTFSGIKTTVLNEADNKDLRDAILKAVPKAVKQTKKLSEYFRSTNEQETCKRIFDFLKNRVKYKADDWRQTIQLPSALLRPGAIADCKSLSLFTAAILHNLNIPYHFVLASYTDSPIPGHIYVRTQGGCIIDVVWGKFNSEKKAKYKYDMQVNYLSGTSGMGATIVGKALQKVKTTATTVVSKAKTVSLAPGRNLFLIIVKNNFDGMATKLQKIDQGQLREWWNRIGGNWTVLTNNIKEGASKRSRKLGLLKALKKIGLNGITGGSDAEIVTACTTAGGTIGSAIPGLGTATGAAWGAGLGAAIVAGKAIFVKVADQSTAEDLSATGPDVLNLGADATNTGEQPTGDQGGNGGGASTGLSTTTKVLIGAAIAVGAYLYFKKKK